MDPRKSFEIATANLPAASTRFYGDVRNSAIGAGMILAEVEYPAFISTENRFGVVRGLVIVLTHECDLDQGNARVFNDAAIICPIIKLENMTDTLSEIMDDVDLNDFLSNVSARNVNRLLYIPLVPEVMPLGGYLYLNLISHTHLSKLTEQTVKTVCMLSGEGLRELDYALERHLRRPKADRLPFQPTAQ